MSTNDSSTRYLVFLAFIMAGYLTFSLPFSFFNNLLDPNPPAPSMEINPYAPPLTEWLPKTESIGGGIAVAVEPPAELHQPILVYHHVRPYVPGRQAYPGLEVTPEVFGQQMAWLEKNDWTVVSLNDYLDALAGLIALPAKSVVITFDDANRNQFIHAVPVLQELDYPATFFIYPNAVGRRDEFMDWPMVRQLAEAGFDIGSHSRTHPRLYKMTDPVAVRLEVAGSKDWLERETGVEVTAFAYPFGVDSELSRQAVIEAGYRSGRNYPYGPVNTPAEVFDLNSLAAPYSLTEFSRLLMNSLPPVQ